MNRSQLTTFFLAAFASLALCGCVSPLTFLNPDFASSLGLTQTAADKPGEAPGVLVSIENATGREVVDAELTWRDVDQNVQTRLFHPLKDSSLSVLLICPITEMTLGDVGDLTKIGAVVRLGTGGANDPIVEVEPFGVLLKQGVNYDCGDSVTFRVQPSSATLSGFQVFAFIRRSGATQK